MTEEEELALFHEVMAVARLCEVREKRWSGTEEGLRAHYIAAAGEALAGVMKIDARRKRHEERR